VEGAIRFVGYQTDSSLVALYSGALALLHPSLYESFGFPLVEAMSCNTPVVASGRGGMREVLGEAALYFDPSDTSCLAEILSAVADDSHLRERLSQTGMERARTFSWKRTARATIDVYEAVARQQVRR
jgi:alpha-1,3-rhamnosyl/mannosyltransferase